MLPTSRFAQRRHRCLRCPSTRPSPPPRPRRRTRPPHPRQPQRRLNCSTNEQRERGRNYRSATYIPSSRADEKYAGIVTAKVEHQHNSRIVMSKGTLPGRAVGRVVSSGIRWRLHHLLRPTLLPLRTQALEVDALDIPCAVHLQHKWLTGTVTTGSRAASEEDREGSKANKVKPSESDQQQQELGHVT
jgi:hypothetical protein